MSKERVQAGATVQMICSVMPVLASCKQVILLCDGWYPKKPVSGLVNEFANLEMVCSVRIDMHCMIFLLNGRRAVDPVSIERAVRGRLSLFKSPRKEANGKIYFDAKKLEISV